MKTNEIPNNPSESFKRRNPHLYPNHNHGLRSMPAEPSGRTPLVGKGAAEPSCWHPPDARFEIVFTVYSVRPADYDGYNIKALQDFLIKAGVIPSDQWDVVAGRTVSRKAATEAEERTEIEVKVL